MHVFRLENLLCPLATVLRKTGVLGKFLQDSPVIKCLRQLPMVTHMRRDWRTDCNFFTTHANSSNCHQGVLLCSAIPFSGCNILLREIESAEIFKSKLFSCSRKINDYSPKWRSIAVDIYQAATFADTEVNNCFSIYHTCWITSGPKTNLTCLRVTLFGTGRHFVFLRLLGGE